MTVSVIELRNVSRYFQGVKVVNDVSFQIRKGSFTVVLGKNGSGKSTILNLIFGFVQIQEGDILLFGESVLSNPSHLLHRIGYVSEKVEFDNALSVEDFVPIYGSCFRDFDLTQFNAMASELELNTKQKFSRFSRGQKMQVAMLLALAQNPDVLLIDEITAVLDATSRNKLLEWLSNFVKSGKTVLVASNIVDEVQHLCTDVLFLSEGRVMLEGGLSSLKHNFRKIRVMKDDTWIHDERTMLCGFNGDGSRTYVIPNDFFEANREGLIEDRRSITLEDVYIYYNGRGSR